MNLNGKTQKRILTETKISIEDLFVRRKDAREKYFNKNKE
jgi:hypothetical protein